MQSHLQPKDLRAYPACRLVKTLQELIESIKGDLDSYIDYRARLCSGGYRTPSRIKQADDAEEIQQACGLLLADASLIWKAAGGVAGKLQHLDLKAHARQKEHSQVLRTEWSWHQCLFLFLFSSMAHTLEMTGKNKILLASGTEVHAEACQ